MKIDGPTPAQASYVGFESSIARVPSWRFGLGSVACSAAALDALEQGSMIAACGSHGSSVRCFRLPGAARRIKPRRVAKSRVVFQGQRASEPSRSGGRFRMPGPGANLGPPAWAARS